MDDILGLSRPKPEGHAQRIKTLVRDVLDLPNGATLMVSELHCHEDGCPDVETVIAVMTASDARRTWKLGKAMANVDLADIETLLRA